MPLTTPYAFLPNGPLHPGLAFYVGLALLLAGLGGEVGVRWWRVPRVTGYTVVGLLAGAGGLNLLGSQWSAAGWGANGRTLIDIALGMVLFDMGSRFSLRWVRSNPWMLATSLLEAGTTFCAVGSLLWLLGVAPMTSVTVAGVAMGSSPAVIVQLRNEFKSEGQITERMMALATLNTTYAVLVVNIALSVMHQAAFGDTWATLAQVGYWVVGSALVAGLLAWVATWVLRVLPSQSQHSFVLLFGLVLMAVAACRTLQLPGVLVLLLAGIGFKNRSTRSQPWPTDFGSAGKLLMVILFVMTPLMFQWRDVLIGGVPALALLLVRLLTKTISVSALSRVSGLDWRKGVALGLSLSPLSALAYVLSDDAYRLLPDFDPRLHAIVSCGIVVMQLCAPLIVVRALVYANETVVTGRSGGDVSPG